MFCDIPMQRTFPGKQKYGKLCKSGLSMTQEPPTPHPLLLSAGLGGLILTFVFAVTTL